ncbi:hypothetical protein AC630_08640 [Bradyrhizobium sp. AS23.2]|nr:hypothetical protein AC630_08640 [Bradyrhizobium sp. AS23.2]
MRLQYFRNFSQLATKLLKNALVMPLKCSLDENDIIQAECGLLMIACSARSFRLLPCQLAFKFAPSSASNSAPFERRGFLVALVSLELAGIAEARRARVA